VAILVVASMFHEEMPWLYELGMEAYRVSKDGSFGETPEALERFRRGFHVMSRGPFLKDSDIDPELFHMLEHHLERLIARPPREYRPEPKARAARRAHREATARTDQQTHATNIRVKPKTPDEIRRAFGFYSSLLPQTPSDKELRVLPFGDRRPRSQIVAELFGGIL
jgi:hypothetical protein